MATFQKFHPFVEAVVKGKHNFGSDTFKFMLTNAAPLQANGVKADLTEIAAGNGYAAGGSVVGITSATQTSGTLSVVPTADVVFTASGGPVGAFRYVVLYNDTATNKDLVGFLDRGSEVTLLDGETFTVDVQATLFTMS